MIKVENGQVKLVFGSGDINIVTGSKDDKYMILMRNQEARDIGRMNGDEPTVSIDEYQVVMEFDKIESIDVVITALEEIKILKMKGIEIMQQTK